MKLIIILKKMISVRNISAIYENLRKKQTIDKYEYILPNIIYGKIIFY